MTRRPDKGPGSRAGQSPDAEISGVLGMGLDGEDGHKRVTKGADFLLFGGSEDTHGRMADVVLRMRDKLKQRGKTFRGISRREFEDLARDSLE